MLVTDFPVPHPSALPGMIFLSEGDFELRPHFLSTLFRILFRSSMRALDEAPFTLRTQSIEVSPIGRAEPLLLFSPRVLIFTSEARDFFPPPLFCSSKFPMDPLFFRPPLTLRFPLFRESFDRFSPLYRMWKSKVCVSFPYSVCYVTVSFCNRSSTSKLFFSLSFLFPLGDFAPLTPLPPKA